MVVNTEKTKTMDIGSKFKVRENINLDLNGSQVKTTDNNKLLGVHFDQNLNWSNYIDILCKRVSTATWYFSSDKTFSTISGKDGFLQLCNSINNRLLLCCLGKHLTEEQNFKIAEKSSTVNP
jgi:hypothetical protein